MRCCRRYWSQALGAEKGERVEGRLGYRSGYYVRSLITRVGKLELRVPQDRQGRFSTWGGPDLADMGELLVIESKNVEKNENRGTNRYGRRFDEEFKRDAVRMLKSGERSAQQLGQELGVSVWSLKRWSKEVSLSGQPGLGASELSEPASALELARLRRELEFVTRQREILKKALGILGQDPWNSSR